MQRFVPEPAAVRVTVVVAVREMMVFVAIPLLSPNPMKERSSGTPVWLVPGKDPITRGFSMSWPPPPNGNSVGLFAFCGLMLEPVCWTKSTLLSNVSWLLPFEESEPPGASIAAVELTVALRSYDLSAARSAKAVPSGFGCGWVPHAIRSMAELVALVTVLEVAIEKPVLAKRVLPESVV